MCGVGVGVRQPAAVDCRLGAHPIGSRSQNHIRSNVWACELLCQSLVCIQQGVRAFTSEAFNDTRCFRSSAATGQSREEAGRARGSR